MTDAQAERYNIFPATIVKIVDDYTVVINKGEKQGIKMDQRFLIYSLSKDPIVDPIDSRPLGHLEIVKGTGEVVNVQDEMSTIKSDMEESYEKEIVRRRWDVMGPETVRLATRKTPFDGAEEGDKAKPI